MYQPIAAVELIATTSSNTLENSEITQLLWPSSRNVAGKEKPRDVFFRHGYALKRLVFGNKTEVSLAP